MWQFFSRILIISFKQLLVLSFGVNRQSFQREKFSSKFVYLLSFTCPYYRMCKRTGKTLSFTDSPKHTFYQAKVKLLPNCVLYWMSTSKPIDDGNKNWSVITNNVGTCFIKDDYVMNLIKCLPVHPIPVIVFAKAIFLLFQVIITSFVFPSKTSVCGMLLKHQLEHRLYTSSTNNFTIISILQRGCE